MTHAALERLARAKVLGKSPLGALLRMSERLWGRLPASATRLRPVRAYGRVIHALARLQGNRTQFHGTYFLRNRPELDLIGRLAKLEGGRTVRVAVLGCSNGAEAYSIMWAIRSTCPGLCVVMHAVDISPDVVEAARAGLYTPGVSDLVREPVLERVTDDERARIFDREASGLRVQSWIREGISWEVGDAGDPRIEDALGPQDIVVANRFLCHMDPGEAERCLRNIARLVRPGGHLFVSGIDLDVRTRVAEDLGWQPVRDALEEIHGGDPSLTRSWPCSYWGLEPLDKERRDWCVRYASVFRLPERT